MNRIIYFIIFLFLIILVGYMFRSKEHFKDFSSEERCDFRNYNDINMAILITKNGVYKSYDVGIHFMNIDTDDIDSILIKGYATVELKILLKETKEYVWIPFTNYNDNLHKEINKKIIKSYDLPIGKIVEMRTKCNKPINGMWSPWKETTSCSKDTDGYCYYEKERSCSCILPAFGGLSCFGPNRLKIDCPCE